MGFRVSGGLRAIGWRRCGQAARGRGRPGPGRCNPRSCRGGAHLGGTARGHAVQVKSIAASALGAFVEAHGNRAGGSAHLAAQVRVAAIDRVEQRSQGQSSLQSEVVGVESGHDGLSFRAALHGPSGHRPARRVGQGKDRQPSSPRPSHGDRRNLRLYARRTLCALPASSGLLRREAHRRH
jgi:predicted RNA-binding protein with RPS1 domain